MRTIPAPLTAALLLVSCAESPPPDRTVPITAETDSTQGDETAAQTAETPVPEVEPRPAPPVAQGELPEAAQNGVQWLVAHQLPSGAWGQGDESPQMGAAEQAAAVGSVADTCMATIALIRAGNTPRRGPHRAAVARAVYWVMDNVEGSDEDSMWVTEVRGTRVQSKIGQYVDTFATLNLFNELQGEMPNAAGDARLAQNLARVVHKLEANQTDDGTWAQSGWAPTLGQSLATRGLNRAARGGAAVSDRVLDRAAANARQRVDTRRRQFRGGAGRRRAAGVELYDAAEAASTLAEDAETQAQKGGGPGKQASPRAAQAQAEAQAAYDALSARIEDPSFVRGFGSNGGEEFLSYLLISETMRAQGGERWTNWRAQIGDLLAGVQNGDGSWTGHHCITGRTFCTAMAVMVLLADRAPVPAAS